MYLLKKPTSVKKKKRIGRGISAGQGKTAGRGHKGQLSRSGSKKRPWFEGGQMPLQRRVPKRGFTNIFRKEYQVVNLVQLNKLTEKDINPQILKAKGLIAKENNLVKILANGDVKQAITITADSFSKAAIDKIKAVGGEVIRREAAAFKEKMSLEKKTVLKDEDVENKIEDAKAKEEKSEEKRVEG